MKKVNDWGILLKEGYSKDIVKSFFEHMGLTPYNSVTLQCSDSFCSQGPKGDHFQGYALDVLRPSRKMFTLPDDWVEAERYLNQVVPEKGVFYKVVGSNFDMIGLITEEPKSDVGRCKARYISTSGQGKYINNDSWCFQSYDRHIVPASDEEIDWLNYCMTINKYVSIDEFREGANLPKINGYDGEFDVDNKDLVIYGCARISIKMLKKLLKSSLHQYSGNRTVSGIIISSSVIISIEEIQQIIAADEKRK